MSDEKSKVADKASEIARNIWLAGVGAYGKAVEDAQDRLEKAMEPPKLFRELVKAGTALEEDARGALHGSASARQSVEERINRVRENFQLQRPARVEDIEALHRKIDALTGKIEALSTALEQQGLAVKPQRTRAAKQKPAAKKTRAGAGNPARKNAQKKKAPKKTAAAGKAPPKKRGASATSSAAGKTTARKR